MCSAVSFGFFLLILSCINIISVNCVQCYGCHGEYCNDPFNRDRATIVNCSYNSRLSTRDAGQATGGNEATNGKFQELQSLEAKLMSIFFNKNTEYVCVKSSYYNSVHQTKMTIRRCMPKSSKNMDACGQLSNIINTGGYGTVQNCMSCDTNLCNSATSMTSGLLVFLLLCIAKSLI